MTTDAAERARGTVVLGGLLLTSLAIVAVAATDAHRAEVVAAAPAPAPGLVAAPAPRRVVRVVRSSRAS